jgi:hypothetical protein
MWDGQSPPYPAESLTAPVPPADVVVPASLASLLLYYLHAAGGNERGGVLLGRRDGPLTRVTMAVFPQQLIQNPIACSFDGGSIEVISAAKAGLGETLIEQMDEIVGWVHSHPGIGLFLSPTDMDTLSSWRQLDERTIAVVADPFLRGATCDRLRWWQVPGRGHELRLDQSEDGWLTIAQVAQMAEAINRTAPGEQRWDIVTARSLMTIMVTR